MAHVLSFIVWTWLACLGLWAAGHAIYGALVALRQGMRSPIICVALGFSTVWLIHHLLTN